MEAAPAVMKGSSFDVLTSMVFLQLAFSQAYMTTKSLFALPRRLIMPDIFFFPNTYWPLVFQAEVSSSLVYEWMTWEFRFQSSLSDIGPCQRISA